MKDPDGISLSQIPTKRESLAPQREEEESKEDVLTTKGLLEQQPKMETPGPVAQLVRAHA